MTGQAREGSLPWPPSEQRLPILWRTRRAGFGSQSALDFGEVPRALSPRWPSDGRRPNELDPLQANISLKSRSMASASETSAIFQRPKGDNQDPVPHMGPGLSNWRIYRGGEGWATRLSGGNRPCIQAFVSFRTCNHLFYIAVLLSLSLCSHCFGVCHNIVVLIHEM